MAACEEAYGFLPCSTSIGGSLCLIVAYGYLLLNGANLLSDGSEMLLEILNPGIIGGLVLPVLGALPDTIIVIVSGLGGSAEEAQEQVAVGVGTLAGSTIMLLTIVWGGSVLLGRCDLGRSGRAKDQTLTRTSDMFTTGVTVNSATALNAFVMTASAALYLTIQIPTLIHISNPSIAAMSGAVLCFITLVAYCIFQIVYPELQKQKMERAHKRRMHRISARQALIESHDKMGHLLDEQGNLKADKAEELFNLFDANGDGTMDITELKGFLLGMEFLDPQANTEYWMKEFDRDQSGTISKSEFTNELNRWFGIKGHPGRSASVAPHDDMFSSELEDEENLLMPSEADEGKSEDEAAEVPAEPLTPRQIAMRSTVLLFAGMLLCAFFSDPMVDAVTSFSKASGIPSFFVAFIVTPLASNASELVSSLRFAATKKKKNISLTFGQVYGAVTMNNTMCLGLFLLIISIRHLQWTYTSEVIVIITATILVGVLGMTKVTLRSFWALVILTLYPLAILAVYVMDNVFHIQ